MGKQSFCSNEIRAPLHQKKLNFTEENPLESGRGSRSSLADQGPLYHTNMNFTVGSGQLNLNETPNVGSPVHYTSKLGKLKEPLSSKHQFNISL